MMREEHTPGLHFPLPLPLEVSAALVGSYRWMEHQLFVLTGGWVQEMGDVEARLHLDLVSGEHGWHAELWEQRLPVLDRFDPERLTRPVGPAMAPLMAGLPPAIAAVAEASGAPGEVLALGALYRVVVPRLVATYEHHLSHAVPSTDGPTIRILRMVLRDELESWQSGERLVQRLLARVDQVEAVAEVTRRLETVVVAAGVGTGLVPWPPVVPAGA